METYIYNQISHKYWSEATTTWLEVIAQHINNHMMLKVIAQYSVIAKKQYIVYKTISKPIV